MKRWYVAYTQPQSERRAAANLLRQGFETYVPCHRKARRHARKTEFVQAPLFPRYLFVGMDLTTDRWRSVNGTFGVCQLICRGDRPAPIPEGTVEALRKREDADGCLAPASLMILQRGMRLRIVDGALVDRVGVYERMTADERVTLLLDLLGRQVEVAIPIHAVEAA